MKIIKSSFVKTKTICQWNQPNSNNKKSGTNSKTSKTSYMIPEMTGIHTDMMFIPQFFPLPDSRNGNLRSEVVLFIPTFRIFL